MKRIVAAAVVAAGISLLTACAQPMMTLRMGGTRKNAGGPDTFVTLAISGTDCVVTAGVGTLGGRKNGTVVWHVNNGCGTAQYLVITHYQEYLTDPPDPTKLGPVVTDVVDLDPLFSKKITKNANGEKVKGTLVKDNSNPDADKAYKYWICISPSPIDPDTLPKPLPTPPPSYLKCLDPDVDIWP